ncbi:hypothetical protein AGR8A_Lc10358 [Agrobacterium fabrum str. J-07]|nr:hypothetical protein AGR8A_Lc10358 [Agrobacterium fabrum str. J-07]
MRPLAHFALSWLSGKNHPFAAKENPRRQATLK